MGQTWSPNWLLPLGETDSRISEITWVAETTAGEAQLHLLVTDHSPVEVNVYCVHLAITDPWQEECGNFAGEKEFVITVLPDEPMLLHLRVSLQVNGFEMRWEP